MTEKYCRKGYKIIDMNSVIARSVPVGWNAPYLCLYVNYESKMIS